MVTSGYASFQSYVGWGASVSVCLQLYWAHVHNMHYLAVSGILVVMAFSQRTSTVQSLIEAELSQRKLVIIAYCVTLA